MRRISVLAVAIMTLFVFGPSVAPAGPRHEHEKVDRSVIVGKQWAAEGAGATFVPEGMKALVYTDHLGRTAFTFVLEKASKITLDGAWKNLEKAAAAQPVAGTESTQVPSKDEPPCQTVHVDGTLDFYPWIGVVCEGPTYTNCNGAYKVCPE